MDKIKCAVCEYARQDITASEYARKQCKTCDDRENCEICRGCDKYGGCKARRNPKAKQNCERRLDNICSGQALKWAAVECGSNRSEYYKSLLNVSINGRMQKRVTWSGCYCGKRRGGV